MMSVFCLTLSVYWPLLGPWLVFTDHLTLGSILKVGGLGPDLNTCKFCECNLF